MHKKLLAFLIAVGLIAGLIIFSDWSAHKDYKLNKKTGVLEVGGEISEEMFFHYYEDERVRSLVARDDLVLPEDCSGLFKSINEKWFYLESIDLSRADASRVKNATQMFADCTRVKTIILTGLDTSNITSMEGMFYGCNSLVSLELSSLDTSNVSNMNSMFSGCKRLKNLDLSGLDTHNVTDMRGMFENCYNLNDLNLSGFDTSAVKDMTHMFRHCRSMTMLDLSIFNTANVEFMYGMFEYCSSLISLDLSSFDNNKLKNVSFMFTDCISLETIYIGDKWRPKQIEVWDCTMFENCNNLVGGKGTTFDPDSKKYDYSLARADGGSGDEGYFTLK